MADAPVHPVLSSSLKVAMDELRLRVGCAGWIRCVFAFIRRSGRNFVAPLLGRVGCWRLSSGLLASAAFVIG